jgi:5-hydroxyisourate hydrolase
MTHITTHVLDTSSGQPATQVRVELARLSSVGWEALATAETNADGRVVEWLASGAPLPANALGPATYQLRFDVREYFTRRGQVSFFPEVRVVFEWTDGGSHLHVPLLLSPYGYSTYRGS